MRLFYSVLIVTILAGCRLPPEREALKPLPEDAAGLVYADLLHRARQQASVALEAFYVDSWKELEEAAEGLEQTARFLPKAMGQPPEHKDAVNQASGTLKQESTRLLEAARAKNVDGANQAIQRITLQIRTLQKGKQP
jgi:hypothetical protein